MSTDCSSIIGAGLKPAQALELIANLPHGRYPVYIGQSIFTQQKLWKELITNSQICIVTNATIAPLYLSQLTTIFSENLCSTVILPDGEKYKQLQAWLTIIDALVANKCRRNNTTLIALGGGVIGDVTGFAAACYHRGVDFIQVPTTLLAQVDAAIGGKTGVNYHETKNLIGAFHQPKAVIIDTDFLSTLPRREFLSGLAEIIKYALIHDKDFFDYLYENIHEIVRRSPQALVYVIERSCRIKIQFIEQDEYDLSGTRALLNFGHTFGHALESVTEFTCLLHGEAVAWGMRQACYVSNKLGYLLQEEVARVEHLLERCELLIQPPEKVTVNALMASMNNDKKNNTSGITLVLLKHLGEAFVTNAVPHELVLDVLSAHVPLIE